MNLTQPSIENNPLLPELTQGLGYSFRNIQWLEEALTHRSYALSGDCPTPGVKWNERLEFLGDEVLGLVISQYLFAAPDPFDEGDLSKIRASLVNETQLAYLARELDIGPLLRMGTGEVKSKGCEKTSVLADALEAIFGAIFLDGGFAEAQHCVLRVYRHLLALPLSQYLETDFKTKLQEWTQERFKEKPSYEMVATTGPAHMPEFQVAVAFRGARLAVGNGPSKKHASQDAARLALESLPHLDFKDLMKEGKGEIDEHR